MLECWQLCECTSHYYWAHRANVLLKAPEVLNSIGDSKDANKCSKNKNVFC